MDKQIAVVGFGRMNPPTIGHLKLAKTMARVALHYGTMAKLYLSHSQDSVKNPLSYDRKLYWCSKAFGDIIDVVESPARTVIEVLAELYKAGVTDIIYVGGGDRIGGEEDISGLIEKYNGVPDKKGNIVYDFNSIQFENAGDRDDSSDDLSSRASASLARKCVSENNFELFCEIEPFDKQDCMQLFSELKLAMGITEALHESDEGVFSRQRKLNGADSIAAVYNLLRDELKDNGADNKVLGQFEIAVASVKAITDTMDIKYLTGLESKLKSHGFNISASDFVKVLGPTEKDIEVLLSEPALNFNGDNDISKLGLSEDFTERLVNNQDKFKSGNTANVGKYENFIALVYKNGTLEGNLGDVSVEDKSIEVKHVKSMAAVGVENNQEIMGLLHEFDDFLWNELDDPTGELTDVKGRPSRHLTSYSESFDKEVFTDYPRLAKLVSGRITYQDLFKKVFTDIVNRYATGRFDYFATCFKNIITVMPSDGLAEKLLANYTVRFCNYQFGRVFKITHKSSR